MLIIDAEKQIRNVIAVLLHRSGYETLEAQNGSVGVDLARRERPDVILCDGRRPEMDGLTALEVIRCDEVLAEVPFSFVSGNEVEGNRERAKELGVAFYLSKPFRKEQLLSAVGEA